MNVVTIPKSEYKKLQKEQRHLRLELSELKEIVQEVIKEEVIPSVAKRLLGRSKRIDKGGGLRLGSYVEVKKYLRQI